MRQLPNIFKYVHVLVCYVIVEKVGNYQRITSSSLCISYRIASKTHSSELWPNKVEHATIMTYLHKQTILNDIYLW